MVAYTYQFWIALQKRVNLIKKSIHQDQKHVKQNVSFDISVSVDIEASYFDEILEIFI